MQQGAAPPRMALQRGGPVKVAVATAWAVVRPDVAGR